MRSSKAISILRSIGASTTQDQDTVSDFSREYYRTAYRNKIPLTYLNSLSRELKKDIPEFNYHKARYQKRMNLLREIAELFEKNRIEYAIFKTLKPFPEFAADIDILNLGPESEFERMVKILTEKGYSLLDRGPLAFTLCDISEEPELARAPSLSSKNDLNVNRMGIMVDVHNEIGISRLVYIDKEKIKGKTVMRKIDEGSRKISSFPPQIELATSMAHSVIKERKYLLADYYQTSHYLRQMSKGMVKEFIDFVNKSGLTNAVEVCLNISSILHEKAFETQFKVAEEILDYFESFYPITEKKSLKINESSFPYRINRMTWLRSLAEKLREENFRKSVCKQFAYSPDVFLTRGFLEKVDVL